MPLRKTLSRLTAGLLLVSTLVTPAFAATGTVDAGSSRLRVRAQSNTGSAVLGSLATGKKVEVLSATDNGWYQISYNNGIGYVSGKYLSVDTAALEAEIAAREAQEAEAAQAAPSQDIQTASVPSQDIQAPSQDIQAEAPAEEDEALYVRVTTSVLNVRSGPGTSYGKTGRLTAGKVVEVLETTGSWYKISSGYISSEYTMVVDQQEAQAAGKGSEIAEFALTLLGCPYVYGGSTPKGFDCSGLTKYVYKQFGYTINRTASNQLDNGTPVSMSELQPGDLVMFKKAGTGSKRASHVGIYIGGGQFVHASSPKVGTIVSNLSDSYYTTGFVGGRRIVGS